jgi:long-chain acyl-CoA synthetase
MRPATVCELFQLTAGRLADREALRTRAGEVTLTWQEYAEGVREIAAGLAALGLARGETLALILVNRPEFHLVDTAALHLGAVPFSLYNGSSPEQIEYLLRDSDAKIVVTEQAFLPLIERTPTVEHVFVVDGTPSLTDLAANAASDFDFEARWRAVQPSDLLTLIYTSGTTGPPKGVQITHANYLAELRAFDGLADLEPAASFRSVGCARVSSNLESVSFADSSPVAPVLYTSRTSGSQRSPGSRRRRRAHAPCRCRSRPSGGVPRASPTDRDRP